MLLQVVDRFKISREERSQSSTIASKISTGMLYIPTLAVFDSSEDILFSSTALVDFRPRLNVMSEHTAIQNVQSLEMD